ncbi:Glucan 1,3-beta-glucosidase 3 [Cladophialophora chaetospira]|uniref:Glucan 1,3-beta-glucosidase 3 n=1 Tax=Cladophialophora chaetospira TaxID=386627 RepID=A0AA38X7S6_9EURO|nr:Glucan 1,3-beta-glucosidase 3 [Cladophialophora chaetospira]
MRKAFRQAFQEVKEAVGGKDGPAVSSQPPIPHANSVPTQQVGPPTSADVLRYRYQHGTNLGSIFILEQWLFGSLYDQGVTGSSELDAINASINTRGLEATRQKWEAHWNSALTDSDLDWLVKSARCNSIRLPVGYFTLGPAFCDHTAYSGAPSQVYINAWQVVKRLVSRCFERGIGILIDLHGVPGGANHETHSGTSGGKAELWGNGFFLDLATRCLLFIADETARDPQLAGVIGIQVCNEAIIDPPGMYEWYNSLVQQISAIDASLPIYISDGWDLGRAVRFTRAYNNPSFPVKCPVFVDTHKYWTFDEMDTSRSPYQIIDQVKTELGELDSSLVGDVFAHQAAVAVYVGEYSLALAPQTWNKAPGDQKDQLMTQFGLAQSQTWQTRACGSAFWTFKMEWMPGWEWGFKAGSDNGQIAPPLIFNLTVQQILEKLTDADARKPSLLDTPLNEHTGYWSATSPGRSFEHWRYADGWNLGWQDARVFFAARLDRLIPSALRADATSTVGADFIGALDLWALKRMREAGVADSSRCPCGWEFEHGFRRAVRDFGNLTHK